MEQNNAEDDNRKDAELLTVREAAQEVGLTEPAVRNAIYRGRLAAIQKYGRTLIERGEFERYRASIKMGRPFKEKPPTEH